MSRPQKQAEKASKKGEHRLHRLGAVVALKKETIAIGWNRNKTHPKSTHEWSFLHAEMDALIKAGNYCSGADLYVARIGRDGILRNAKPCPACMAMILASGIKKVYFTDNNGWHMMKVRG